MRTAPLIIILLLYTASAFSQNTSPWPSTGSVGIGTTTPSTPIEIVVSNANTNTNVPTITLTRKTSGTASTGIGTSVEFKTQRADGEIGSVASLSGIRTGIGTGSSNHGALVFKTQFNSTLGLLEGMRINKDGMVGIGNSNPEYLLDVSNTTNSSNSPVVRLKNAVTNGSVQLRLENDVNTSSFFICTEALLQEQAYLVNRAQI
jgi:hypothetical protein